MRYFFVAIGIIFSVYNLAMEIPCVVIQDKHSIYIGVQNQDSDIMTWKRFDLPYYLPSKATEGIIKIKKKK